MIEDDTTLDLPTRIERRRRALRVGELADLLSVSTRKIYVMVERSKLPSYQIDGSIRFDPRLTAEWLRRHAA